MKEDLALNAFACFFPLEETMCVTTDHAQAFASNQSVWIDSFLYKKPEPETPSIIQTFDDVFGAAIEAIPDELGYLFEEMDVNE